MKQMNERNFKKMSTSKEWLTRNNNYYAPVDGLNFLNLHFNPAFDYLPIG